MLTLYERLDAFDPRYAGAFYLDKELSALAEHLDLFLMKQINKDDTLLDIEFYLQDASGKRYLDVFYKKAHLVSELKRVVSTPCGMHKVSRDTADIQALFRDDYSSIISDFILTFTRKNESKFLLETSIDTEYKEFYLNMDRKSEKECIEFIFADPIEQ